MVISGVELKNEKISNVNLQWEKWRLLNSRKWIALQKNALQSPHPSQSNSKMTKLPFWGVHLHISEKGQVVTCVPLKKLGKGACVSWLACRKARVVLLIFQSYTLQFYTLKANYPDKLTSTMSLAKTMKLWLRALEAKSPLGRESHCLLTSASMASTSMPSPATTKTTWLSGPCSA